MQLLRCASCGTELNLPTSLDRNYLTLCPNPNCRYWLCFNWRNQEIEVISEITPKSSPKVFFSHSFMRSDAEINEFFRALLLFFFVDVVTIERDTRPLDKIQKAREGIKSSHILFIVMPKRYKCYEDEGSYFWRSSEWIQNEIGMAYAFNKNIVAVIEEGVKDEGMLKDLRWCYTFNRDRLQFPWIEENTTRNITETKERLLDSLEAIQSWCVQS